MITTRVVEHVFLVLSFFVCFRSYSDGDNPRSYREDDPHGVQ